MVQEHPPQKQFNRRRFIGAGAAIAALTATYYLGVHRQVWGGFTLKHSRSMMGTIVNFTIIGKDQQSCHEALMATVNHMEERGRAINGYDQDSQISILNRQGYLGNADPTLLAVTKMSKKMGELTGGAFDPTVLPLLALYKNVRQGGALPSQEKIDKALSLVDYRDVLIEGTTIRYVRPGMGMTLDGLGKGHIVDDGVRYINELGFANVCIEAGGDLMVTGTKRSGKPWTIAIRNPRPGQGEEQIFLEMKNRAIATSGDYMQAFTPDRQFHHIINPQTGFSPPELASSSILAPSVAMADGLATSTMVLGAERSLALLETLPGCEGFLIGKDLKTHYTKDFFKNNETN